VGHVFPAQLPPVTVRLIGQQVRAWLAAVGLVAGAAHVEFRLHGGCARLIEINPRLPGGQITELVRWCTGIDLVEKYLDFHLPPALRMAPSNAAVVEPTFGVAATRFILADEAAQPRALDWLRHDAVALPTFKSVRMAERPPGSTIPTSNYDRVGYLLLAAASRAPVTADLARVDEVVRSRTPPATREGA
jgi:biotin carboxylase